MIRRCLLILAALLSLAWQEANAGGQYFTAADVAAFRSVYQAKEAVGCRPASEEAERKGYPVIARMILWECFRSPGAIKSREDVADALRYFLDWPDWKSIQRNIEASASDVPLGVYPVLFDRLPPVSPEGALLKARLQGIKEADPEEVRRAWRRAVLSEEQERYWLSAYRSAITEDDVKEKIEYLVFKGETADADRLIARLRGGDRTLFEAWASYKRGRISVTESFKRAGPAASRSPLYFLEAVKADVKNERFDQAYRKLASLEPKRAAVQPEAWWSVRKRTARELFDRQRYQEAYVIVSRHGFDPGGEEYAEAEWMAGWLALAFMKKYERAQGHFLAMAEGVAYPISLARAYYWLGRSYAAGGKEQEARQAYEKAASYGAVFYGQLAKLHAKDSRIAFPRQTQVTREDKRAVEASIFVKAGKIWRDLGRDGHSETFLEHAIDLAKAGGERLIIASLPLKAKDSKEAVQLARYAYKAGTLLPEIAYPRLPPSVAEIKSGSAIVHAVILQESRFDRNALSSAGAMGLMQIMPGTAQHLASRMGLQGNAVSLARDPRHNVRMGTQYLRELLQEFEGSRVMTAAAYNAGVKRVYDWRKRFGNPLKARSLDQVINWIEIIPFYETRNYVQRVLENINVYSALEKDAPIPVSAEMFL
jgi:soluble lytic murein transglycosylase